MAAHAPRFVPEEALGKWHTVELPTTTRVSVTNRDDGKQVISREFNGLPINGEIHFVLDGPHGNMVAALAHRGKDGKLDILPTASSEGTCRPTTLMDDGVSHHVVAVPAGENSVVHLRNNGPPELAVQQLLGDNIRFSKGAGHTAVKGPDREVVVGINGTTRDACKGYQASHVADHGAANCVVLIGGKDGSVTLPTEVTHREYQLPESVVVSETKELTVGTGIVPRAAHTAANPPETTTVPEAEAGVVPTGSHHKHTGSKKKEEHEEEEKKKKKKKKPAHKDHISSSSGSEDEDKKAEEEYDSD